MKRLVLFLVVVFAVWVVLQWHDTTRHDPVDIAILVLLGTLFTLSVAVMLIGTTAWSLRALGVFGTMAGDAIFYSTLGAGSWLRWPAPEWLLDLARACFIVGAPLFFFACLRYLRERYNGGPV